MHRQIRFINNKQIALRNPRPTLPRNLIPSTNINHVDNEISKLPRIIGSEIVTPTLNKQQLRIKLPM